MNYKQKLLKYQNILSIWLADEEIVTELNPDILIKLIDMDLRITKELTTIQ